MSCRWEYQALKKRGRNVVQCRPRARVRTFGLVVERWTGVRDVVGSRLRRVPTLFVEIWFASVSDTTIYGWILTRELPTSSLRSNEARYQIESNIYCNVSIFYFHDVQEQRNKTIGGSRGGARPARAPPFAWHPSFWWYFGTYCIK